MTSKPKILIIRLSSIGDIVLTTPVIRAISQQLNAEVHFLTKPSFFTVLSDNPYIDVLHSYKDKDTLKKIDFDAVIDLHHNLKTFFIKRSLKGKHSSFSKLNVEKWLLTTFKINRLPKKHIVDRYLEAAAFLGVTNDNKGLDYFIPKDTQLVAPFSDLENDKYIAVVIGGQHATKILPAQKIVEVLRQISSPFVLVGGPEDKARGEQIISSLEKGINACGYLSLNQSALLVKNARLVISNDTGMMHIAAAFSKKIISVWGNTVPDFGMYPYLANQHSAIVENKDLSCRPCSKIGYSKCPLGHFKCMKQIDANKIAELSK
jgi:ADP-heptose:LPS heptosyltransferase